MKPMLLAFVAIGVIAFGANMALMEAGFSSGERNAAPSVRLD
jgi:hypothetical protein